MACSMKAFDRRVRKAISALERAGARVRVKDGGHVLLYPPAGQVGPMLKVSASRKAEESLHFIRVQYARPNGLERHLP
jgi:hypothetical protein